MKKYEITGETKQIKFLSRTVTLHRIRAVVEVGLVKVGELGGWIENEENLSCDGNAWVYGNAKVCDNARVYGDAEVFLTSHILVVGPIGSRNDFTTFFRDKDGEITVKCGCFLGKNDEFLEKVTATHGNSRHALVYRAAAETAKLQIGSMLNRMNSTRNPPLQMP